MKIRTRILTAVLATATAFSCALTASALNPQPEITVDNSKSAAILKVASDGTKTATATLTLSSKNFEDVTGAKVVLTLPAELSVTKATISDKTKAWTEAVDYKVKGNTVTLVDVFNIGDATAKDLSLDIELTVSGTALAVNDYSITVSGDFADTNVDQVYTINAGSGTLKIDKEETTYTAKQAQEEVNNVAEGYFIPYGGVYVDLGDNNYKYPNKDENGAFNLDGVDGNVQVLKCKLPTGDKKVTTFGYGKKYANENSTIAYERVNGLQFGSYAIKGTGVQFGTLVIMGDYNSFKKAVAVDTDDTLMQSIINKYDSAVAANDTLKDGDAVTFSKDGKKITVKKVAQTKKMWENTNYLQYAVRLIEPVTGKTYTTVGYSYTTAGNVNTYTFSAEIQSRVNPFA